MKKSQLQIEFDKWLSTRPVLDPDNYSLFQAFKAGYEAANESDAADVRPYCRNHEIYYDFELGCPACTSRPSKTTR